MKVPRIAVCLALALLGSSAVAQDAREQPHIPAALDPGIPLTPAMIEELRDRVDKVARADAGIDDPGRRALPMSRSVTVSLSPGQVTNIIQTTEGFPTAVTFLDQTGQPWPIAWDTNSNPGGGCGRTGGGGGAVGATGLQACVPVEGSNVVQITPMSRYPRGGLIVSLKGAPKPIAFLVQAGPGRYDADLTVRVIGRGPNAVEAPVSASAGPATGSPQLTAMLDGTPPAEAVPMRVSGISPDSTRAWHVGHSIYLRTQAMLLSPGPTQSESEYGTTVYEIPETTVVLLSAGDQAISATLTDVDK